MSCILNAFADLLDLNDAPGLAMSSLHDAQFTPNQLPVLRDAPRSASRTLIETLKDI
jgi:hypothetical protein